MKFDISSSPYPNLATISGDTRSPQDDRPASPDRASSSSNPPSQADTLQHAHAAARARALGVGSTPTLPQASLQELKSLIDEARSKAGTQPIHLAGLLAGKGFSSTIADIRFSDKDSPSLRGLTLDGIDFRKCSFTWSHLSDSSLSRCRFSGCEFANVAFQHARLHDCVFEDCTFRETLFLHADLAKVRFLGSTLQNSSFENAKIDGVDIEHCALPGTHFLDASVSQSRIAQSDLTDAVFLGKRENFAIDEASLATAALSKPTTATLVPAEARGISVPLVGEKLVGVANTNPVRVAMQTPTASKEDVDREVEEILHAILAAPPSAGEEGTIPQRLLRTLEQHPDRYPNAAGIVQKARTLAAHVDSVVLPGGEDVSPLLYGEGNHGARWEGDYRRSLLELGLIDQCFQKAIPLMSICRGFQMTSVYFGARLHQHIGDGQVGVQILGESGKGKKADAAGIYGDTLQGIRAAVYHHQAVPDAPLTHLQAPLSHTIQDGGTTYQVVMALEKEAGAPLMGLQFHPEFFKQNPGAAAGSPELTNEELRRQANAYVRPGTEQAGLRDPSDMVDSGILDHMSQANDQLWKILADSAKTRLAKAGITKETLVRAKEALHEPANRIQPRRGAWKRMESRIADTLRSERKQVRELTLSQLKAIAENQGLPPTLRKEAKKEIGKRIDPYSESGSS